MRSRDISPSLCFITCTRVCNNNNNDNDNNGKNDNNNNMITI